MSPFATDNINVVTVPVTNISLLKLIRLLLFPHYHYVYTTSVTIPHQQSHCPSYQRHLMLLSSPSISPSFTISPTSNTVNFHLQITSKSFHSRVMFKLIINICKVFFFCTPTETKLVGSTRTTTFSDVDMISIMAIPWK